MPIVKLANLSAKNVFPGVSGRYAHTEKLTLGEVELAADVVVPLHQHPHEQLSYVLAGSVEFTVGGETRVLDAGMCALIPSGVTHGVRTRTTCRLLDIFTPVREDYR